MKKQESAKAQASCRANITINGVASSRKDWERSGRNSRMVNRVQIGKKNGSDARRESVYKRKIADMRERYETRYQVEKMLGSWPRGGSYPPAKANYDIQHGPNSGGLLSLNENERLAVDVGP